MKRFYSCSEWATTSNYRLKLFFCRRSLQTSRNSIMHWVCRQVLHDHRFSVVFQVTVAGAAQCNWSKPPTYFILPQSYNVRRWSEMTAKYRFTSTCGQSDLGFTAIHPVCEELSPPPSLPLAVAIVFRGVPPKSRLPSDRRIWSLSCRHLDQMTHPLFRLLPWVMALPNELDVQLPRKVKLKSKIVTLWEVHGRTLWLKRSVKPIGTLEKPVLFPLIRFLYFWLFLCAVGFNTEALRGIPVCDPSPSLVSKLCKVPGGLCSKVPRGNRAPHNQNGG